MFSIRAQFKRTFLSPLNRALSPVTYNRGFRLCHMGARRLKQWLLSFPVIELARRTWRELGDDFAVDLAASISYYAILSLFPLAIGLVSLFSMVLEAEAVEREVFGFFRTYLPGSDGILAANVEAVGNIRGLLGIASVVGLGYSSSLLFWGHHRGGQPGVGRAP